MTLEHLIRLSENFSDEIPENVLHGKGTLECEEIGGKGWLVVWIV